MLGADRDPNAIWDDETGETFAEAMARFETLGYDFVEPTLALQLIKAGYKVWSFGYGDDPAEFDVLDSDDIENFEEDMEGADALWGPFRFDGSLGARDSAVRFAIGFVNDWVMSPLLDDISRDILSDGLRDLALVGITR